jgi:hypothetical protein
LIVVDCVLLIVVLFSHSLLQHPDFASLAEIVADPDIPGSTTRRFYIELRGFKSPLKRSVLNMALLLFSQRLIKKEFEGRDLLDPATFAAAQYESTSIDTLLKCLFAVFTENSIQYSREKDFKFSGSFSAYWNDTFEKCQSFRPDFGTAPNASCFDPAYREKTRRAIELGKLRPFENVRHFNMLVLQELQTNWLLRSCKEPVNIRITDLEWQIMSDGDFVGQPTVRLKESLPGQKREHLSLAKPKLGATGVVFAPMPQILNDPYSLYNLLRKLVFEYMPPNCSDNRILRRAATKKQIEVRFSLFSCSFLKLFIRTNTFVLRKDWRKQGQTWVLDPRPSGAMGHTQPNVYCKELAKICEYDNAQRCTGQGNRKAGISALANSSENIASKAVMVVARHTNANTNVTYQTTNAVTRDKTIRALQGGGRISRDKKPEFGHLNDRIGSFDVSDDEERLDSKPSAKRKENVAPFHMDDDDHHSDRHPPPRYDAPPPVPSYDSRYRSPARRPFADDSYLERRRDDGLPSSRHDGRYMTSARHSFSFQQRQVVDCRSLSVFRRVFCLVSSLLTPIHLSTL